VKPQVPVQVQALVDLGASYSAIYCLTLEQSVLDQQWAVRQILS
jgi:hypothetical protein